MNDCDKVSSVLCEFQAIFSSKLLAQLRAIEKDIETVAYNLWGIGKYPILDKQVRVDTWSSRDRYIDSNGSPENNYELVVNILESFNVEDLGRQYDFPPGKSVTNWSDESSLRTRFATDLEAICGEIRNAFRPTSHYRNQSPTKFVQQPSIQK